MKLKSFVLTSVTFWFAAICGTPSAQAATLTTIVDGISNARGVSFGPDGTLYVAEPGIGGNGNCQPSPSTLFQPICAGNSGSLVKVTPGGQPQRILTNFQSLAEQPSGNQGAGIQDLQFDSLGNAYLLTGFAGYPGNRDLPTLNLGSQFPIPPQQLATFPPSTPDKVLNTPLLAQLYKVDLNTGSLNSIFDFAKYEITKNPDGGDVVTNPYDLAISGDSAYVVDGGGNTAYKIKLDGTESQAIPIPKNIISKSDLPPGLEVPPGLLDELPGGKIAIQSVPTGGAIGPDGALYVGEYTGFPYPEDKSRIFRIGEDGNPEVYLDGFTHITDLTFDEDGNLLVLQFSDTSQLGGDITNLPGSLIKVAADGTRTTLVAAGQGLDSADGIDIGPDGKIYITNRGVGPELGEVVRVDGLVAESIPEPGSVAGLLALASVGATTAIGKRKRVPKLDEDLVAKAETV
ncbi:MAG: ScyD/ScyE family protein [Nostoc sp. SerVER01]|nr:ScyD/ScyE family protein [Nostoc sp. SerVER01]MDZ8026997.1 ScyD/ScyE family protein [Nostoc sp. DedQUE11]MDZ8073005.1 ScyD/ScyE family protein [Nostoc sp. DedQUE01]MDZ8081709.1 ScyD/ScyE family protein [Nostoc sp. DcaGUA01]